MFSMVVLPVYIPTNNSAQGHPFLHIISNLCYLLTFGNSLSNRREVIAHCGLALHFPDDE